MPGMIPSEIKSFRIPSGSIDFIHELRFEKLASIKSIGIEAHSKMD